MLSYQILTAVVKDEQYIRADKDWLKFNPTHMQTLKFGF